MSLYLEYRDISIFRTKRRGKNIESIQKRAFLDMIILRIFQNEIKQQNLKEREKKIAKKIDMSNERKKNYDKNSKKNKALLIPQNLGY